MLKKVAVAVGAVAFAMLDANPSLWIYDKLAPSNAFYENKNIWITGASSGIGAELAVQLSEAGANVVISARREKEVSVCVCCSPFTILSPFPRGHEARGCDEARGCVRH